MEQCETLWKLNLYCCSIKHLSARKLSRSNMSVPRMYFAIKLINCSQRTSMFSVKLNFVFILEFGIFNYARIDYRILHECSYLKHIMMKGQCKLNIYCVTNDGEHWAFQVFKDKSLDENFQSFETRWEQILIIIEDIEAKNICSLLPHKLSNRVPYDSFIAKVLCLNLYHHSLVKVVKSDIISQSCLIVVLATSKKHH